MQIQKTVHADVYNKLKRLYGVHVDQIQLLSRPIQGTDSTEYAAICSNHGAISGWTRDITTRTIRVRDHLKDPHG